MRADGEREKTNRQTYIHATERNISHPYREER